MSDAKDKRALGAVAAKAGWIKLIKTLRHNPNHKKLPWIDLGSMILHYVVWIGVPMIFFAPASVLGFYVLRTYLIGYALFAVLAPGHFPSVYFGKTACLTVLMSGTASFGNAWSFSDLHRQYRRLSNGCGLWSPRISPR